MQPGIKYAGYGILNAFHEFQFIPTEVGKNQGRLQIVKQGKGWSVHSTKENIIIHIKIERKDKPLERVNAFLSVYNELIQVLKDYDLSKKPSNKNKKK